MTSTDPEEVKCTNDNELPWKMVAKDSRSSTMHNKKSIVRVATSGMKIEDKSLSDKLAGESASEKLGHHFTGRVEHLPIKKGRFMVPPLSPKKLYGQRGSSELKAYINHALPFSRLNPNLVDKKTSKGRDEKQDCTGYDFSGIAILADAACSSDMSNDIALNADRLLVEEHVIQQQDVSTFLTNVEGNDSQFGTADVSKKYTAVDTSDKVGKDKKDILVPQKSSVETSCNDLANEQSIEHIIVKSHADEAIAKNHEGSKDVKLHWHLNVSMDAWGQPCDIEDDVLGRDAKGEITKSMVWKESELITLLDESSAGRPKANMVARESKNLAHDIGATMVSEKPHADEHTKKNNEVPKDVRLHWNLNVSMDVWGQPCDVEDDASRRDAEGEMTESMAPKESQPTNGSKDHMDAVTASYWQDKFSSSSKPIAEVAAKNGKEYQSGYDSQFEDGELREPWEENEGDTEKVEHVDYRSQPEDERFHSMVVSNDNKMEYESNDALRIGKATERSNIEKDVVVNMNDSHKKMNSTSLSRNFVSKTFKELPSHDVMQRKSPDSHEELRKMFPDKFVGRGDKSRMHMRNKSPKRRYFNKRDSRHCFWRPQPKGMVDDQYKMDSFVQSGSGLGFGSGHNGYVRRPFSNGRYRYQPRRFPDDRDSDFKIPHGEMHNHMSGTRRGRGNTPVFRRFQYTKSDSRSRSRSPISRNGRNRSSPCPGGFRAAEGIMERVKLPFQNRFPVNQEMGFMPPPRNRMSSPRFFDGRNNDYGENHNSFKERKFWSGNRFVAENSMERLSSDSNNSNFGPFLRHKRFDGVEVNTGVNRFEMTQHQARQFETSEDDNNNI